MPLAATSTLTRRAERWIVAEDLQQVGVALRGIDEEVERIHVESDPGISSGLDQGVAGEIHTESRLSRNWFLACIMIHGCCGGV